MARNNRDIYISTPLHEYPQLRILSGKLFRAGYKTLGKLSELSGDFIRHEFKTTPDNVARIRKVLRSFDLDLR